MQGTKLQTTLLHYHIQPADSTYLHFDRGADQRAIQIFCLQVGIRDVHKVGVQNSPAQLDSTGSAYKDG
jgi:hypothetical protein